MCKGTKKLCGLSSCPLLKKIRTAQRLKSDIKQEIFGPSREIFVGSYGYPNLSAGPLVSSSEKPFSPKEMYGMEYDKIIEHRSILLRGKRFYSAGKRIEENMQDVALSIKPVNVEVGFSKKPFMNMNFSSIVEPMGPSAPMKKYRLADNPKIPKRVDTLVDENLKAAETIKELSVHGFDNYYLIKLMSAGVLGTKKRKRIVPTRWSITALDDTLAKQMMEKIREFEWINRIYYFHNSFLHNNYHILVIPGAWEFENFEAWAPKTIWAGGAKKAVITEEFESFEGRSKYADKQAGGYYASRIAVVEYLVRIKRQARVLVIREIDGGYAVPVGVFQVREGVRHAFAKKPAKFSTVDEALEFIGGKLSNHLDEYKKQSRMLQQRRISDFLF
ncbi:hypothetical protein JXB01_04225 [Candidatus Micrarchaeota archaeon]|nr:hypothetical protein [Candidatus Micrarchaeota archaeon]